jgi:hypothetical protein
MAPTTNKQWIVTGTSGFDALKWDEKASVPQVGDKDVLVKSNSALCDDMLAPI